MYIIIPNQFQCLYFSGKNFLRAGQMNINVVTWGRLMKRALPQQCADNAGVLSPASQIGSPGECLYYVCDDTQQPHRWCNG
jgi:hypothetical protein